MSTPKLKTPLPEGLRREILEAKSDLKRQISTAAQARKSADDKISELQAFTSELLARIEIFKRDSITSDQASSDLVNAERRLTLIAEEISRVTQARDAAPDINIFPAIGMFQDIFIFYRDTIKDEMLAALAPYGYPEHLALPLIAHADAMKGAYIVRDWMQSLFARDESTIGRIFIYFQRALDGEINLHP